MQLTCEENRMAGYGLQYRMDGESVPVLQSRRSSSATSQTVGGLSLLFTTLLIVDLFGVFPVVALPGSIIECGWFGVPLVLIVIGLQIYTAVLLGRCWVIAENIDPNIAANSRSPYSVLAEVSLGRTAGKFVSVLLDVTVFGAGIPNLLFASQNLQLIGLKMTDNSFNFSFCYWIIILGLLLCPMICLGSPKDIKWLSVCSVCTVAAVSCLTWSCMLLDQTTPPPAPAARPLWESLAIAYGIIAFQFDLHPVVLTLQVDMKCKNKLGYAVVSSFLVTGSLFFVTTAIAALKYGRGVNYNLLQGLPASLPFHVDLLLITLQIYLSMVVSGSALFQDIEDFLNIPREFNWKRCIVRSGIALISVLIGEVVPRFDLVMGLIGGSLTGPLVFILPPILYTRLRAMQTGHNRMVREIPHDRSPTRYHTFAETDDLLPNIILREPIHDQDSRRSSLRYTGNESEKRVSSHRVAKWTLEDIINGDFTPDEVEICNDNAISNTLHEECALGSNILDSIKIHLERTLSLEDSQHRGDLSSWEKFLLYLIVLVGVLATITSTFLSVRNTIRYASFTLPCFW